MSHGTTVWEDLQHPKDYSQQEPTDEVFFTILGLAFIAIIIRMGLSF